MIYDLYVLYHYGSNVTDKSINFLDHEKKENQRFKNVESAKKDTIYTRIKEVQKFKKFNKQRYNQSLFIHDDSQAILNENQTKTAE